MFLLDNFHCLPYSPAMAPKVLSSTARADRTRVGATLRALRRTRGWRLGDFAAVLGISHAYLSNIEAGRKPLPDHLLARASRALGVEQIAIKLPDRGRDAP
jgi:transcriptional regulator with XRE-family HTH domain